MNLYQTLLRPFLFRFEAERAHHLTLQTLQRLCRLPGTKRIFRQLYRKEHAPLHRSVWGLDFPNPVGLAAGFDKNARFYRELSSLGFGFVEVGTVTPLPQEGNPRPRLFRFPRDEALLNRMGFNNDGVKAIAQRLKDRPSDLIIGANIGKNKSTPLKTAYQDYETCFRALADRVDYFVVNVSSPNTPQLRELQEPTYLNDLLTRLQNLNQQRSSPLPLLLKISPDLVQPQIDQVLQTARETEIYGLIATNTTTSRDHLSLSPQQLQDYGPGGISGRPLTSRSTKVIQYIHQQTGGTLPIIGVGGIQQPHDALVKLEAGASLIQVYTGFIYRGPQLISGILNQLLSRFDT